MNTSTNKCKATSHEFYVAVLPFSFSNDDSANEWTIEEHAEKGSF